MRYEGNLVVPPSARQGYVLQVSMGCSHNKCTFCNFFKDKPFKIRPIEEVFEDIEMARKAYKNVPSIFLVDGNVLCMGMDRLRPILKKLQETFPESKATNMYGTYRDFISKGVKDMEELYSLGVRMIAVGLESGSNEILTKVNKGVTKEEILSVGDKLKQTKLTHGISVLLGLGGQDNSADHIQSTIDVINNNEPTGGIALAVLVPQLNTLLIDEINSGEFILPTYRQIIDEELAIVDGINVKRPTEIFSGLYMPGGAIIQGILPQDKEKVIFAIKNRRVELASILDTPISMNRNI